MEGVGEKRESGFKDSNEVAHIKTHSSWQHPSYEPFEHAHLPSLASRPPPEPVVDAMRIASSLAALLLCALSFCQPNATSDLETLSKLASELPKCVLACAAKHADPSCPLTSMKCACQPISDAAMTCFFKSCKGWDAIYGSKVIDTTCGVLPENDDIKLRIQLWVSSALAGLVIAVRIASRLLPGVNQGAGGPGKLGWDDACVVLSFAMLLATFATIENSMHHGFGRGFSSVSSPDDIDTQVRGFLICSIFMVAAGAAIKASFLFFFARIFLCNGLDDLTWPILPWIGFNWRFKTVLLWTHVVNVVSCLALISMASVQCQPLSYYWTGWDGIHTGYCLYNKRIAPLTHIIAAVILDFWFLYLPIPIISTLRMSPWTKVGIMSMFSLGIIVTIVSLIRLYVLVREMQYEDLLSNYMEVAKWSTAEMPTAIVCACIPSLRWFSTRMLSGPYRRVFEQLWVRTASLCPGHRRTRRRHSQRLGGSTDGHHGSKYNKNTSLSMPSRPANGTIATTATTSNIASDGLGDDVGTPRVFIHSEGPQAVWVQAQTC
ncbi:hypothetical protein RB595_001771 [Gaeumannomyces hyphopodioides]